MSNAARWTREFSTPSSFSDDLGALGTWVGPRTGNAKRTLEQKEDYVLRRVLVALNCQKKLSFPFTVCASNQMPKQPDFTIRSASGTWGLEVAEAGSESHQEQLTVWEKHPDSNTTSFHLESLDSARNEIRSSIKKKIAKYDSGWYRGVTHCDLAVYDNTNSFSFDRRAMSDINDQCLQGRFREVFFIQSNGRQVYRDVLSDHPEFIDIASDYNIDFAEWIGVQVARLRQGQTDRLDVEQLIEELSALAKKQRRALGSQLQVLLLHLLKWQFQPALSSSSWEISINNARNEIEDLLTDSPSLAAELSEIEIPKAYQRARKNAAAETGLSMDSFPEECPFEPEKPKNQLLREDWFPR